MENIKTQILKIQQFLVKESRHPETAPAVRTVHVFNDTASPDASLNANANLYA